MLIRYANFIVMHPLRVVVAILLLAALPAAGLRYLAFSLDYRDFFGGNDIHVKTFDEQQDIYAKVDNVLMVVEPSGNSVFTREFLTEIERATEKSWKLPHATRVDSISNFQHSYAENDLLVIESLVSDAKAFSDEQLSEVKRIALSEPLLVNKIISADGRLTAINITLNLPADNIVAEMPAVVKAVRDLAAAIEARDTVAGVYLTGTVMINNAFFEIARGDLLTLMPIMFALIIVSLSLLLRSVAATMVTFLVVGLANAVALGGGGFLGIGLTPPSSAAAPIIMTLSIAACVHLITTYFTFCAQAGAESGAPPAAQRRQAMVAALRGNLVPITLTSATTAIGFSTMNFAESPPFHDLGNLVVIGVIAAYLFTMTLLPALMVLVPVPAGRRQSRGERALEQFSTFVVNHHRVILAAVCALVLALVAQIPRNQLNDEFVKYFDTSVPFRQDNDFITNNITGVYLIDYSLGAGEAFGINEPEYLQTVEAFARWFESQPEVWHVQPITDIYKKSHMILNNGDPAFYRLPLTRELAAQSLFMYEMSLPPGLDLNDKISVDKSATKFTVSVKTISANEMIDLERRADHWLEHNAPSAMRAVGTGPAVLFAHIGARSITAGLAGGLTALLLISAILMLALKSVKIGLLSLVPNIVPAAMGFGVWGLTYAKINMALATVISMTIGIVVDDTIHFLDKYLRARRAHNLNAKDSVRFAITRVGGAIVVTTIVLIAGFLVLLFSPFVMNWGMGLLTAIIIGFALLTDLLLLPPLLIAIDGKENNEDPLATTVRT